MISTCICSNRPASVPNVPTGEDTCLVTLLRWHGMHCRVHVRQSLFTDGQTKRVATNFRVARIPGWESPCSAWNTVRRNGSGTYGRTVSVLISQYNSTLWSGNRTFLSCNALEPALIILRSSLSFSCAAASVWWSIGFPIASMRDRVSATLFSTPFMWRISVVNCPT